MAIKDNEFNIRSHFSCVLITHLGTAILTDINILTFKGVFGEQNVDGKILK